MYSSAERKKNEYLRQQHFLCIFAPMNDLLTKIYSSNSNLPKGLLQDNFFHSRNLFELSKNTPRHKPYLVTVETKDGEVLAQLLALVRYRSSFLPPYFYIHCRVLGEGAYRQLDGQEAVLYGHVGKQTEEETEYRSTLFEMMLETLQKKVGSRVLYIEFSNLSQKMFGYRSFRQHAFFPVKWMSIHNSLHSRTPEERISDEMKERIDNTLAKGIVTKEVENEEEFRDFIQLLKHHNWFKPRRYMPADEFFKGVQKDPNGKLFITKHHNHIIGCSAVVYSQKQAYLWYSAFRRKTFAALHPDDITVWHAIKDAHENGYEHIFFLDVGLPFQKNRYRDFILRFGGKPVSTYRWFYCGIGWINRLLSKIYE